MNARKIPGAKQEDHARAQGAEAARQEKRDALLLRDTALSESEVALLEEVFAVSHRRDAPLRFEAWAEPSLRRRASGDGHIRRSWIRLP